jgi:hypothetical protein
VHQSFINYRNYRYAALAITAVCATSAAYMLDKPRVPPNGGTLLGYTLGTIAGLLIIFLSLFGIRKRAFHSRVGTAIGWLSAHVYLGLAALLIATLHTGLHFGINIHTATYVLMCLVTLSGAWGMYAYIRYPGVMSKHRGSLRRKELLQQISDLDQRSLELAAATPQIEHLVAESIRRTDLGENTLWSQLRARDHSSLMVGGESAMQPARMIPNPGNRVLIEQLAQLRLATPDGAARTRVQNLLELAGLKSVLLERLRSETQLAALLRIWLYIHVPLCCALLAALGAHILTVFLYW